MKINVRNNKLSACLVLSLVLTGCSAEKKDSKTDDLVLPVLELPVIPTSVPTQPAPLPVPPPPPAPVPQPQPTSIHTQTPPISLVIQVDPAPPVAKEQAEHESLKSPARFLGLAMFAEDLSTSPDHHARLEQVHPATGWQRLEQSKDYVADQDSIIIQKTFHLPDLRSNDPNRKMKHYFTFDQNALSSKIVEAKYQVKIKRADQDVGTGLLEEVPLDIEEKRFFLSLSKVYKSLERFTLNDVHPEDTQVLFFTLFLENGQRKVVKVQYQALGEYKSLKSPARFLDLTFQREVDVRGQVEQVSQKGEVLDDTVIRITDRVYLPTAGSQSEFRNRKESFVWSQDSLDSRVITSSYSLKTVEKMADLRTVVTARGVSRPVAVNENGQFILPIAEIYRGIEGYSEKNVKASEEQILTLKLNLENQTSVEVQLHYTAIGAVVIEKQGQGLAAPSTLRELLEKSAERMKIYEETLTNSTDSAVKLFIGVPTENIILTTGFTRDELKAGTGPHSEPTGPYSVAYKASAPLKVTDLEISGPGIPSVRSVKLSAEPLVEVDLQARAQVTLVWYTTPVGAKINLPQPETRTYSWTVPQPDKIETFGPVQGVRHHPKLRKLPKSRTVTVKPEDHRHPFHGTWKELLALGDVQLAFFPGAPSSPAHIVKKYGELTAVLIENGQPVNITENYEIDEPYIEIEYYTAQEAREVRTPVAPLLQSREHTEVWKINGAQLYGTFSRQLKVFGAHDSVTLEVVQRNEVPPTVECLESSDPSTNWQGGYGHSPDAGQPYAQPEGYIKELSRFF